MKLLFLSSSSDVIAFHKTQLFNAFFFFTSSRIQAKLLTFELLLLCGMET